MRIGFDATPLLGPKTGVGWYTEELVRAVATTAPADDVVLLPVSWRLARDLQPPPLPNVAVVRRFTPARPLRAFWHHAAFPPLEWFLRCDVFHAPNFIAPPARRTAVVTTVHDLSFVRHPEQCTPPNRRIADLLPGVLRRADAIVTISAFSGREVCEWMPEVADRVHVIYPGGHRRDAPSGADPGLPTGPPYVLVLGKLAPRKNLPLALDAFALVRKRGLDLRLVLAGPPDPLVDVDHLVDERGLAPDEVVRTGYVDDDRAAALLAGACVFAFPSLYEGFGMPLVEAMEAGVPVIAVRAAAMPETVGPAGLLVDADDTEGFADALERLVVDDGLRARMVAAGHAQASRFSWETAGRETHRLYRSLV